MLALALIALPALADDTTVVAPGAPEIEEVAARRPPPPPPWRRPPPPPPRRHVHVAKAAPPDVEKDVTLAISPLHLAMGMIQLEGEFRASDDVGLVLTGGLGSAPSTGTLYDLGAQLRGYAVGDFDRGFDLGLQASYGNADLFWVHDPAWALGPVIGGKYTFDGGFTVDAQVGGQVVHAADYVALAPIATLNVGFSF